MPATDVQVLVDAYRERQRTGVLRLGYDSEEQLCLLVKRGEPLNAYLITPEKWEVFPAERVVEQILAAGDAYAKFFPLSPFSLLNAKLLMQSSGSSVQVMANQTQLAEYLASFSSKGEATLAHLAWKNAAGMILFTQHTDPRFSFVSQDITLDEQGSYKVLCEWSEPESAVTIFPPDLSVEAWQEYYLRDAFANICESSLSRFEVLTGRALVDSLIRLVNVFTDRQNIDISIMSRKLTDNEVFPSPKQAAYVYRLLLAEFFNHFSVVIGNRLYISVMREIIKNLASPEREIATKFELFPKGFFHG